MRFTFVAQVQTLDATTEAAVDQMARKNLGPGLELIAVDIGTWFQEIERVGPHRTIERWEAKVQCIAEVNA